MGGHRLAFLAWMRPGEALRYIALIPATSTELEAIPAAKDLTERRPVAPSKPRPSPAIAVLSALLAQFWWLLGLGFLVRVAALAVWNIQSDIAPAGGVPAPVVHAKSILFGATTGTVVSLLLFYWQRLLVAVASALRHGEDSKLAPAMGVNLLVSSTLGGACGLAVAAFAGMDLGADPLILTGCVATFFGMACSSVVHGATGLSTGSVAGAAVSCLCAGTLWCFSGARSWFEQQTHSQVVPWCFVLFVYLGFVRVFWLPVHGLLHAMRLPGHLMALHPAVWESVCGLRYPGLAADLVRYWQFSPKHAARVMTRLGENPAQRREVLLARRRIRAIESSPPTSAAPM